MSKKKPTTAADKIRELAWLEDGASRTRHRTDPYGYPVPPTAEYFEAVAELFSAYDKAVLPYARHAMAKWKDALAEVQAPNNDSPYNPLAIVWTRFWRTRDEAHAALFKDPPKLKPRPTPTAMKADGATNRTIALELRWTDPETGLPDLDRVARELETPGSEYTKAAIAERDRWHLQQLGYVLPDDELAELETEATPAAEPEFDVSELGGWNGPNPQRFAPQPVEQSEPC